MLTISKRAWLAGLLAAMIALVGGIVTAIDINATRPSDQAAADFVAQGGGQCPPGDPSCSVDDHEDPEPGDPGGPGGGDPGGGGGGPCVWTGGGGGPIDVADQTGERPQFALVAQSTIEVPCNHPEYGFWSGGCYYGNPPPLVQPPDGPPDGQSAEDGQWYYQRCPINVEEFNGQLVFTFFAVIQWQWFENGEVPVALPSPLEVAQDWLANIELLGIDIELTPPETGAGLVPLPVWLGVNQTENTWGTISDSHCLQGVCVSIEASVDTVNWSMGDGASFDCARDRHVAWQPGMDYLAPGGNCHHYYESPSRDQPEDKYQITATSHWAVHWEAEASGASGDLETTREATVALEIDEIQVLTR